MFGTIWRRLTGWLVLALSGLGLTTVARGQVDKPRVRPRSANHYAKLLELDSEWAAASRELLRRGAESAKPLAASLDDPRPEVVLRALRVLKALGPAAKASAPRLEKLAGGGDLPLARAAALALLSVERRGGFVAAHYGGNRIVFFNAEGEQERALEGHSGVWHASPLPGGMLVVEMRNSVVRELDAEGEEVWSRGVAQPYDAERLVNGNTLLTEFAKQKVIEIDEDGEIVWSFDAACLDADRLVDGNTLIADYNGNRFIEVSPAGKIVWSYEAQRPYGVERLPNGNTILVTSGDKNVIEVDPDGEQVWAYRADAQPTSTLRRADGTTIVATANGIVAVDRAGEKVWTVELSGYVGSITAK